jgi:hypothetical protein
MLSGRIFEQEKMTRPPSISLKRKATTHIIVIEDDPMVSHLFLVDGKYVVLRHGDSAKLSVHLFGRSYSI